MSLEKWLYNRQENDSVQGKKKKTTQTYIFFIVIYVQKEFQNVMTKNICNDIHKVFWP